MKKINKQDFVGQSTSSLDEAIKQAFRQAKFESEHYKVIEMIGSQQTDNKKNYHVVLCEREEPST